jgi:glycosyltransferase involved in cell wall biosynthesis
MYSVCILFYNEYPTIIDFTLRVKKTMTEIANENFEIILIDDCSTDINVDQALTALDDPKIRIIRHPQNLGYAFATRSALKQSVGDHIIILDGDGEYPEQNISKFIAEISPEVALILPLRNSKYQNWKRRVASFTLTLLCRVFLNYPENDINGGAKYINSNFKSYFQIQFGVNLVNPELWVMAFQNDLVVKFVQIVRVEKSDSQNSKVFKKPHKLMLNILNYIFQLRKLLDN